jgi:Protein of unknown function (DUF3467)
MTTKKSINFTIVPEEPEDATAPVGRIYSNFCGVSHTPFDFTLTFCEVLPLSEKDIADAPEDATRTIRAPIRTKVVIPVQLVAPLAAALSENLRNYQESYTNIGWIKGQTRDKDGNVH